jgi:hypothetical protein
MMSRSRGSIDMGLNLPGFHNGAPGTKGRKHEDSDDSDEDFGKQAKTEIEKEDELKETDKSDPSQDMRDTLARALKEDELR